MTSPPAPDPGVDCFPVRYCSEGDVYCTALGTSSPAGVDDDRAVQVFIDADGYVWLVVLSYEREIADDPIPHWVWLFKSTTVFDCDEVTAAGSTGWQPTGSGSHGWFDLVHEGLHADSGDCAAEDAPLLDFDAANLFVRFFKSRGSCCTITDPCNPTPLEACGPYETVECDKCAYDLVDPGNVDNLAPGALLVEITAASSVAGSPVTCDCSGLVGSYVVPWCCEGLVIPCLFVPGGCGYEAEFDIETDCGTSVYATLSLRFQLYQLSPGGSASLGIVGEIGLIDGTGTFSYLRHIGTSSVVTLQSCTTFADVPMTFTAELSPLNACGSISQGCTVTMTVSPIT